LLLHLHLGLGCLCLFLSLRLDHSTNNDVACISTVTALCLTLVNIKYATPLSIYKESALKRRRL